MGKKIDFEAEVRDVIKKYLGLTEDMYIQKATIKVGVDSLPKITIEAILGDTGKK